MLYFTIALLLIIAFLWINRACLALKTLQNVPAVQPPEPGQTSSAKVSILIPARNEEKNLPVSLPSLLNQTGIDWECLVANDRSTDGTENALKKLGLNEISTAPAGTKKRYLNIPQAGPAAWTGKNYALTQLVPYAAGDWFLFTDADTCHEPFSLLAAVLHAEKRGLEFLTLLPRCIAGSWLERVIQPSAMGFMGLWFPLFRVNQKSNPLTFANGQFILIGKSLYERLGGHAAVAQEFLEDFALMRKAGESGAACGCHFGQNIYGTRMYQGLREIWRGWRRIYRHASQDSVPTLIQWLTGVFAGAVLPFILIGILLDTEHAPFSGLILFAWTLVFINLGILWITAAKTYRMLRAPVGYAIFHPLAAILISGILADAIRVVLLKRNTRWRG